MPQVNRSLTITDGEGDSLNFIDADTAIPRVLVSNRMGREFLIFGESGARSLRDWLNKWLDTHAEKH